MGGCGHFGDVVVEVNVAILIGVVNFSEANEGVWTFGGAVIGVVMVVSGMVIAVARWGEAILMGVVNWGVVNGWVWSLMNGQRCVVS